MEDLTDTIFREIVLRVSDPGRLQVLYTEFTKADGMNHPVGKLRVGEHLIHYEEVLNCVKIFRNSTIKA